MTVSVTVVIVTFNSAEILPQCLASLDWADHIVLVDNASRDGTPTLAARLCPRARIIANPTNLGFGAASNQGALGATTDFILFLNPDGEIDRTAIALLLAAQSAYDAAVVAPLLVDGKGNPELRTRDIGGLDNHYSPAREDIPDGPVCMAFLTGAALLWKRTDWLEIGGFDERIFLFWEDFDLSVRTFAAKKQMILAPHCTIRHLGGRSTPPSYGVRWLKEWHMIWGDLYIRAKYGDAEGAKVKAKRLLRKHGLLALQAALGLRRRRLVRNLAAFSAAWRFLRDTQGGISLNQPPI